MTRQKHDNLSAYVIHARPFRETSLLIEFFTDKLGRCSAISRGAYSGKSPKRFLLQPFTPLVISLQGSTDLLTLTHVERTHASPVLEGQALVCGLYLNELLYYLLHRYDPHPELFQVYHQVLFLLSSASLAPTLREFELTLLENIGYGIHFEAVKKHAGWYRYLPQQGLVVTDKKNTADAFSSEILKAIAEKNWSLPGALSAAKQITRMALTPLLAGREIYSRDLLFS